MSPAAFQLWRDYFQLAKLVEEMNRYGPSEEDLRRPRVGGMNSAVVSASRTGNRAPSTARIG
ncbi:hypothetical protein L345_00241 [Ophiophagus hannah]|uniref:Uncharacterized protein n=1 Tax=Ophiophagus hannah TaxID=8665 RepID=V8PHA0_OPHHA|nr:hypothetical protein L345_00241 [Ophiophagus hannah]